MAASKPPSLNVALGHADQLWPKKLKRFAGSRRVIVAVNSPSAASSLLSRNPQ